jgi:hypothetical protein
MNAIIVIDTAAGIPELYLPSVFTAPLGLKKLVIA